MADLIQYELCCQPSMDFQKKFKRFNTVFDIFYGNFRELITNIKLWKMVMSNAYFLITQITW